MFEIGREDLIPNFVHTYIKPILNQYNYNDFAKLLRSTDFPYLIDEMHQFRSRNVEDTKELSDFFKKNVAKDKESDSKKEYPRNKPVWLLIDCDLNHLTNVFKKQVGSEFFSEVVAINLGSEMWGEIYYTLEYNTEDLEHYHKLLYDTRGYLQFITNITGDKIKFITLPKMFEWLADDLKIGLKQGVELRFEDRRLTQASQKYLDPVQLERQQQMMQRQKMKGKIFIGNSNNNLVADKNLPKSTFNMVLSGEVLNDSAILPQIRCYVQTHHANSNEAKEYISTKFKKIDAVNYLNSEEIDRFRRADKSVTYFLFDAVLEKGRKTRLLSADSAELFKGFFLRNGREDIVLEKGDDDFYYATSKNGAVISYLTSIENNKLPAYASIDPKIKAIIDEYQSKPKKPENFPTLKGNDYQSWGLALYDCGAVGSCVQRVAAVTHKLNNEPEVDKENFRSVNINGNHILIEARNSRGQWVKVDLGGVEANLNLVANDLNSRVNDISEASSSSSSSSSPATSIKPVSAAPLLSEVQKQILKYASKSLQAEIVNEQGAMLEKLENGRQVLIVAGKKIDEQANFLMKEAVEKRRSVFYIDSPATIDFEQEIIYLLESRSNPESITPIIKKGGLLTDFLYMASAIGSGVAPLLLINWQNFSPSQRLALNSILDKKRSIAGRKVDDSIQIIGFREELPSDPAFLSRHDVCLDCKNLALSNTLARTDIVLEQINIDLHGLGDISQIFGRIILHENQMVWQESEFVKKLKEGQPLKINIINLPEADKKKLEYQFNQAKALEYFSYHGHKIPYHRDSRLFFEGKNFDFSQFEPCAAHFSSKILEVPKDAKIINSYLFDLLLHGKSISAKGVYSEEAGLIEQAGTRDDKILKLFITSPLSQGQYYCLLHKAKEHNVKLDLYFGDKGSILPREIKIVENLQIAAVSSSSSSSSSSGGSYLRSNLGAKIILSNDSNQALQELASRPEIVIDIEDYSYQDLVEAVDFKREATGFSNFKKLGSELVEKLKTGQRIVLKGKFSAEILQYLHPILAGEEPEFAGLAGGLTIIVQNSQLSQNATIPESFSWLDNAEVKYYPPQKASVKSSKDEVVEEFSAKPNPLNFHEKPDESVDLENSAVKAEAFITARKSKVKEFLQGSSLLQLIGHSGVGKSRLIRVLEESGEYQIYHGLEQFEAYATDKSAKEKILFIDESNIENTHLTMFSPLKKHGSRNILHKGKFYQLDTAHKVVFAKNPKEYGGGRVEQKLFSDVDVPEFHLADFSASYIYEKILKEAIFDKIQFSGQLSGQFPASLAGSELERQFKLQAQILIAQYIEANRNCTDQPAQTVRELQEKTLRYLTQNLAKSSAIPKIKSKNFVSTSATFAPENEIHQSLNVSQKQREGILPNIAVGINGVLLQGDSGIGKSEMIKAIFENRGILEMTPGIQRQGGQQYYYKIPASLPGFQKKNLIIEAFEKGDLALIDELNSCIDDGLEKVLNLVLTGCHPLTGKESANPGFRLVATINEIDQEGRSKISPALLHRLSLQTMKPLKKYALEDMVEIIENHLSDSYKNLKFQLASEFLDLIRKPETKPINLRNLSSILENEGFLAEILKTSEISTAIEVDQASRFTPGPSSVVASSFAETLTENSLER